MIPGSRYRFALGRRTSFCALVITTLIGSLSAPASALGSAPPGGLLSTSHGVSSGSTPTSTITATRQSSGLTTSVSTTIKCTISVDDPHNSSYYGVNVHGKIVCRYTQGATGYANVSRPHIDLYLYRQDLPYFGSYQQVGEGSNTTSEKYTVATNAADSCPPYSKSFYGQAYGHVVFPAGYSPQSDDISVQSAAATPDPSRCKLPPALR